MSEFKKALLMRSYAGGGKSYKAKELAKEWGNTVICSADDYWIGSDGIYRFDSTKLGLAHAECYDKFKNAVIEGKNVIIDNTNLKYEDCVRYFDFVVKNNNLNKNRYVIDILEVTYNDLNAAIEARSNRTDGKNIPVDRMHQMYKAFKKGNCLNRMYADYHDKIGFIFEKTPIVEYTWLENTYDSNSDKREAVICDLDGTLAIFKLADGTLLRNPFEASTCNADLINVAVARMISSIEYMGTKIIFLSGREEKYREPTMEFLNRVASKYGLDSNITLYMRKSNDFRSDDIIKSEIYNEEIKDKYNVLCVFDDRPRVVKYWRSIGLFVFDCNYRGEDF